MQTPFMDHFSGHAAEYARYRPDYPECLFEWLAGLTQHHELAWDCACGSGQAALALTRYYRRVIATDASEAQITAAALHPKIDYRVARAECSGIHDNSLDLVTVAQALHWFDIERFRPELQRVLKPGGLVAAWCYGPLTSPGQHEVQKLLRSFYAETLVGCWPPERRHVENGYADLDIGIKRLDTPDFSLQARLTITELCGYISTWSAIRIYKDLYQVNPVTRLEHDLREAIQPDDVLLIEWPLTVITGPLA